MLTQDTKRKIDSARDILVGKVPDPKAQVEQITTALIYKFMDDMDKTSQELGGKARFFTNGYEKYAWTKLMNAKLGGHERLDLYMEALSKLSLNPHIPQLFRDIFKDTFLPYRNPETLSLFLKEINGFIYEHSEDLGDSFEYLLSVLGSQGDAGQFRTPRHIIDFIVETVDPKKDDTICDPACGTAGFLISAYKHILKQHDGKDDPEKKEKPLTPDERKNLMDHFTGYDISPDMVRLSRVNLYLHGFPSPTIYEYDTLSSEEKWDESFDVMLANPPFMTPKGGIKPHKRFSVQANRSEVLFVDYILEHLRPNGRAGIIVPEGIIFQSGNAYKALRKLLVEDGLLAVVSLPSGVFQPYSGVKTGILLFDKALAKKAKDQLFIKIQNDGYGLGARRREIDENDLPEALKVIKKYKAALKGDKTFDLNEDDKKLAHLVAKEKIAESGDYNLSGERYKETDQFTNQKWPMLELGEICLIGDGNHSSNYPKGSEMVANGIPFIRGVNIVDGIITDRDIKYISLDKHEKLKKGHLMTGDVLFTNRGELGKVAIVPLQFNNANLNSQIAWLRPRKEILLSSYLFAVLNSPMIQDSLPQEGATLKQFTIKQLNSLKIPLPPIEVQEQIVRELDGYSAIIDGANQIVTNWKPKIEIDPEWEKVKLGDDNVLQIVDGDRGANYPNKEEFKPEGFCLFLNTSNVRKGEFDFSKCDFITQEKDKALRKGKLIREDVVLTTRGTLGNTAHFSNSIPYENIRINSGMVILRSNLDRFYPNFLLLFLNSLEFEAQVSNFMSGSAQPQLPIRVLNEIEIPLPPLETQRQIVEKIEVERALVESAKKLNEIYKQKIKDKIKVLGGE